MVRRNFICTSNDHTGSVCLCSIDAGRIEITVRYKNSPPWSLWRDLKPGSVLSAKPPGRVVDDFPTDDGFTDTEHGYSDFRLRDRPRIVQVMPSHLQGDILALDDSGRIWSGILLTHGIDWTLHDKSPPDILINMTSADEILDKE